MKYTNILFFLIIQFLPIFLSAQSWSLVAENAQPNTIEFIYNQQMGTSVAVDEDYAVIGAPNTHTHDSKFYAYVLHYDGIKWGIVAKLSPSLVAGKFGFSVAISGDNIVIGAPDASMFDGTSSSLYSGLAFVYTKPSTGWTDTTETAILKVSDYMMNDHFGYAVDIKDDNIVVTRKFDHYNAGSVDCKTYVYTKPLSGWVSATETAKLLNSSATYYDELGCSVAISDEAIVVGAKKSNINGTDAGCAFVYTKPAGGWITSYETCHLSASNIASGDQFGAAVDILNDDIIVGSPQNDLNGTNTGTAYIYTKTDSIWVTMTETAIFTANSSSIGDRFGNSVSIDDNMIVVGASEAIAQTVKSGTAYIFEKSITGWINSSPVAKIDASDRYGDNLFAFSVAISNDRILVGSPMDDDLGPNSGSVYSYQKSGNYWTDITENQKITLDYRYSEFTGYFFGYSIAMDGDYAVVGAKYGGINDQGTVYVFHNDGINWIKQAQLFASDLKVDDLFGFSVAISGNTIVVGTGRLNAGELDSVTVGGIYVYTKPISGWHNMTETARLSRSASNDNSNPLFGWDVAIEDDIIIGSSPNDNGGKGRAYLFERPIFGWVSMTQTALLTPSDAAPTYFFGVMCDIANDQIVFGSRNDKAYVFQKPLTGWDNISETAILTASDLSNQSLADFGETVAISSNDVVVGAINGGQAYVYSQPSDGWGNMTETAILRPSLPYVFYGGDEFSRSLAIEDSIIIIGSKATILSNSVYRSGLAFIYCKPQNGWSDTIETTRIITPGNNSAYDFTYALDISNKNIIITYPFNVDTSKMFFYKPCLPSFDTISISACRLYTCPGGRTFYESGTYRDSLVGITGCDSILTINLTITNIDSTVYADTNSLLSNETQFGTFWQWYDCENNFSLITDAVDSLFLPDSINNHYAVVISLNGCIDTSDCTFFSNCYPTHATLTLFNCLEYTSPSGKYTWNNSGTYYDTLINSHGCDSIIEIQLQIGIVDINIIQIGEQLYSMATNAQFQWVKCNNGILTPIIGATSSSLTPTENGQYAVIVTRYGCTDTSQCFTVNSLELETISYADISIYPTVSLDGIIHVESSDVIEKLEIFDNTGKMLFSTSNCENTLVLKLSYLNSGNYFFRISTNKDLIIKHIFISN